MDGLSAAASAIALAQATKEVLKFARYARSLGDIPEDYRDFVKELDSIGNLAREVHTLVNQQGTGDQQGFSKLTEDLDDIVSSLRRLSEDVRRQPSKKVTSLSSETVTTISTIRWEKKKTEIAKLRGSMRRSRDNLALHLQILQLRQLQSGSDVQQAVNTQLNQQQLLSNDIIDRLSLVQITLDATTHHWDTQTQPETTNLSRRSADTILYTQSEHVSNIHGPLPGPLSSYCDPYCPCRCHGTSTSRPVYWLESLLGTLSVHSNSFGFPSLASKPCDFYKCKGRSSSTFVHYTSPPWTARRDYQLSWGSLSGVGSLHLRVPRVVDRRLFAVIKSRNESLLKRMLTLGGSSATDISEIGQSVCSYALHFANTKIMLILLQTGFDTGISDAGGQSAITTARRQLRAHVADPEDANNNPLLQLCRRIGYGDEALRSVPVRLSKIHRALFARDDAQLARVLEHCLQADLDACDECNWAPIHYAARQGRVEAMRLLLEAGADANNRLGSNCPPLSLNVRSRHRQPEILRLLLARGADPNLRSLRYPGSCTAIMTTLGQPVEMRLLLDAGAHIVVRGSYVETPLHYNGGPYIWTHFGDPDNIEESILMLLEGGLDINHQNAQGRTPLMMAIFRCDDITVRLLLRLGARIDLVDQRGWNILHWVATSRDTDVIDALRLADWSCIDPHQRDDNGNRPYDNGLLPLPTWAPTLSHQRFVLFCHSIEWSRHWRRPRWKSSRRKTAWYQHQQRRHRRSKAAGRETMMYLKKMS